MSEPVSRWDRGAVVPTAVALLCAAVLAAATLWAAQPVYGPLRAEFAWPPAAIVCAAALSLVVSCAALRPLDRFAPIATARAWTTGGLLASGATALLLLPTLTHLWQLVGVLALLGVLRAAALLGIWRTLRLWFSRRLAVLALCGAALAGLWPAAAIVGATIYRNSWREGVAATAGLLLLAAPLAYVLLPGREAFPAQKAVHHDLVDSASETA